MLLARTRKPYTTIGELARNGERTIIIDPNDIGSMWTTTAQTTLSVNDNDPVGYIIDRRSSYMKTFAFQQATGAARPLLRRLNGTCALEYISSANGCSLNDTTHTQFFFNGMQSYTIITTWMLLSGAGSGVTLFNWNKEDPTATGRYTLSQTGGTDFLNFANRPDNGLSSTAATAAATKLNQIGCIIARVDFTRALAELYWNMELIAQASGSNLANTVTAAVAPQSVSIGTLNASNPAAGTRMYRMFLMNRWATLNECRREVEFQMKKAGGTF